MRTLSLMPHKFLQRYYTAAHATPHVDVIKILHNILDNTQKSFWRI